MTPVVADRRDQGGMTMIETLLTVAISALITVPMLGWAIFGLQQHADVHERNVDGTSLGLLRAYFSSDVVDADRAVVGGEARCAPDALERLLELLDGELRTEYVLVRDAGSTALERHRCGAAANNPIEVVQLVDEVLPAATGAACSPLRDTVCGSIALRVATPSAARTTLRASLRVDEPDVDRLRPPTAVIDADPLEGVAPLVVRLDGRRSTDPAGGSLQYAWDLGDGTISDQPTLEHRYDREGDRRITLTVITERGTTGSASVALRVAPGAPTPVIDRPAPGATTFVGSNVELSARGSLLADGKVAGPDELSYRWDLGDGRTATGTAANVSYPAPSPAGGYPLRLTVTDREGRSATTATTVIILAAPRPVPPGDLRQTNAGQERGARFVELAWDRVEGADRYEVYLRCIDCPETARAEESGTTVRVRGLGPGRRTYLASVRSRSAATGEWGDWSTEIEARS